MVVKAGAGWVLAPALDTLLAQIDEAHPGRSTLSDGSKGDTAHAARVSDHNPRTGYVRALDITREAWTDQLVAALIESRDPRIKYLIYRGKVTRSYAKPGIPAWTPAAYTGTNPHDKHFHLSVTDAGTTDRSAWRITFEEDDLTETEKKRLFDLLTELKTDVDAIKAQVWGYSATSKPVHSLRKLVNDADDG